MSELMKKLKKKLKVGESHRLFVRKAIHEANEQINNPGDPTVLKKLKS